jgi:hypothetical protein
MQPESVGILLTTILQTFLCFLSHSTFLLLVLEPNRHSTLKVYFDVCDGFIGPNQQQTLGDTTVLTEHSIWI